jgi:hypothetical protein
MPRCAASAAFRRRRCSSEWYRRTGTSFENARKKEVGCRALDRQSVAFEFDHDQARVCLLSGESVRLREGFAEGRFLEGTMAVVQGPAAGTDAGLPSGGGAIFRFVVPCRTKPKRRSIPFAERHTVYCRNRSTCRICGPTTVDVDVLRDRWIGHGR